MNPQVWKIGAEMADNWDHSTYDTEQIILNTMLWNQTVTVDQVLHPEMAYQAFHPDIAVCNQWNDIKLEQANIMHFHSSRDVTSRVEVMRTLGNHLKII
jgi:hypothetical protein